MVILQELCQQLTFKGLCHMPARGDPVVSVELLADGGYRRELTIPVEFVAGGQPEAPDGIGRSPEWL
jgi:hypothetical protein